MTTLSQTQQAFNQAVVDIVADLAQVLTPEARYQRLLAALRQIFPCDAAAARHRAATDGGQRAQ